MSRKIRNFLRTIRNVDDINIAVSNLAGNHFYKDEKHENHSKEENRMIVSSTFPLMPYRNSVEKIQPMLQPNNNIESSLCNDSNSQILKNRKK